MNKEQLVQKGWEIDKITELKELCGKYEEWKTEVLRYAEASGTDVGKYRMALHAVNVPYESREDKIGKYRTSIKKAIRFLQDESQSVRQDEDALETIVRNFGLYLYHMFCISPENRATLQKDILKKIVINNEYDVQHIMYAVVKALYPSARREVNQDIGYGTASYH